MMMYERMLNKQELPSLEAMIMYCGENAQLFTSFLQFLQEMYQTTQEIRFPYGKYYGWSVSQRKGKKLMCDVFAEEGAFTVMLRLTNKQYDDVYKKVCSYTQEYIDNKYPCSDGGWIHYRVLCDEHLEDVKTLVSVKMKG